MAKLLQLKDQLNTFPKWYDLLYAHVLYMVNGYGNWIKDKKINTFANEASHLYEIDGGSDVMYKSTRHLQFANSFNIIPKSHDLFPYR